MGKKFDRQYSQILRFPTTAYLYLFNIQTWNLDELITAGIWGNTIVATSSLSLSLSCPCAQNFNFRSVSESPIFPPRIGSLFRSVGPMEMPSISSSPCTDEKLFKQCSSRRCSPHPHLWCTLLHNTYVFIYILPCLSPQRALSLCLSLFLKFLHRILKS